MLGCLKLNSILCLKITVKCTTTCSHILLVLLASVKILERNIKPFFRISYYNNYKKYRLSYPIFNVSTYCKLILVLYILLLVIFVFCYLNRCINKTPWHKNDLLYLHNNNVFFSLFIKMYLINILLVFLSGFLLDDINKIIKLNAE